MAVRRQGFSDFGGMSDPALNDLGELAARITGVGLGQLHRTGAPQLVREGFEDATALTARWNVFAATGAVTIGAMAFSGPGSCKFVTGAAIGNFNSISRLFAGYPTAYGIDIMVGLYDTGGAASEGFTVEIEGVFSPGLGNGNKKSPDVLLENKAGGGGLWDLYFFDGAGKQTLLSGIQLIAETNPVKQPAWHNLKVVFDPVANLYKAIYLDQLAFDVSGYTLSDYGAQSYSGVSILPAVSVRNTSANAHTVYVDDVIVTRDEP